MRALAVLTVRNEGAFLLDWLAHHRAVGFTDFLIASNDCDDGTDAMLDALQDMGQITHLPNPAPHEGGVQWAALKRADRHPLVANADWILALDIDEYVNIHVGDGTLAALLATLPDAKAIPLTWRLFGNAGVVEFRDTPITEQFLRAAPAIMHWPWQAMLFKTLFRNDGTYRKLGVHRPRSPDAGRVDQARWFGGSGHELPPLYRRERLFSPIGQNNLRLAQINHYALGAMESFVLKANRGRAVHGADRLGLDYWVDRNFCDSEDRSIKRYAAQTAAIRKQFLSNPYLVQLHDNVVGWRNTQFATLMAQDDARALFGRLQMAPPSRPLSPENAAKIREILTKRQVG